MAIEFRCPNGHRLSCPDERAGKPATCPKCRAKFLVPAASAAATAGGSSISMPAVADSGAMSQLGADSAVPGRAEDEAPVAEGPASGGNEVIIFLCPNGHKLNCPPSMQGKAGKCPHCGARFIIPQADDSDFSEQLGEQSPGDDDPQPEADIELEAVDEEPVRSQPPDFRSRPELSFDFTAGLGGGGATTEPTQVLPRLFYDLWQHREQGMVVEINLRSGATIAPTHYAPQASTEGFAVIAVKEPHGAYTMSVVAWDQIERVTVRGLDQLPHEYFG